MSDIFSHEQIEKFRVIFEQFDKNGDGDISAKELKGALKQLGQVTDTKSCKKMIKAVKTVLNFSFWHSYLNFESQGQNFHKMIFLFLK